MKLLLCRRCRDVIKLAYERRSCACGNTSGYYESDGLTAVYSGDAIPLGFSNTSLLQAVVNQPERGMGKRFEAFVIPVHCHTMRKE